MPLQMPIKASRPDKKILGAVAGIGGFVAGSAHQTGGLWVGCVGAERCIGTKKSSYFASLVQVENKNSRQAEMCS